MKRIAMIVAATVLMGSVAMAQENKKDGQRQGRKFDKTEMVKHRTDEMVKKYALNKEQAGKLLDLNTRYADKMGPGMGGPHGPRHGGGPKMRHRPDSVDGQTGATRPPRHEGKRPEMTEGQKAKMDARRQEMNETVKAYEAELKTIMTDEQFQQYKADMKQHRHHGPKPKKQGGEGKK